MQEAKLQILEKNSYDIDFRHHDDDQSDDWDRIAVIYTAVQSQTAVIAYL